MDQILQGLSNVVCYLDNILITGKNKSESWKNVGQVFQRLQDRGIRENRDKCVYCQPHVTYLGHRIESRLLKMPPHPKT